MRSSVSSRLRASKQALDFDNVYWTQKNTKRSNKKKNKQRMERALMSKPIFVGDISESIERISVISYHQIVDFLEA